MKDINYKDIDEHIKAHHKFKDIFEELKNSLSSSNRDNNIKLFKLLKDWFINHEVIFDKKFI